jgi:hypothetical protein
MLLEAGPDPRRSDDGRDHRLTVDAEPELVASKSLSAGAGSSEKS